MSASPSPGPFPTRARRAAAAEDGGPHSRPAPPSGRPPRDAWRLAGPLVLVAPAALVGSIYLSVDAPLGLARAAGLAAWLSVFTLATLGPGLPLARALGAAPLGRPSLFVVAAGAGAGVLAAVSGALGAAGLLGRGPLLGVLVASAAAGALGLARAARPLSATSPRRKDDRALETALVALLAVAAGVALLAAATPSAFYDQWHYHVAFPERWLASGTIDTHERHVYSFFPANMGLLYVYALAGPGVPAAQAVHLWTGALAAMAAWCLAGALGAGRPARALAAALLATTPALLVTATRAGSDLGPAALGGAAWLLILGAPSATDGSRVRRHLLAGLLAGAAFGCKYVALATVALPLGAASAVLAATRRGPEREGLLLRALPVVALVAGLAASGAPWAARNALAAGNPVHPFFAGVFDGAAASDEIARGVATPPEPGGRLRAALTLRTFAPRGDAGLVGPAWLALVPAWLAGALALDRRRRGLALLAGVAVGVAAWSQFHQLGRYLVPVLVPAAAGIAASWPIVAGRAPRAARRGLGALAALLLAWALSGALEAPILERVGGTLGRVDADEILTRRVSYRAALPLVDALPGDAKLLLVAEPRSLHVRRDVVVEDPFRTPLLVELADDGLGAGAMARRLASDGVTHVLFNEHEAARIARMTGRSAYFAPRTAEGARAIASFFDDCLAPLGRRGPVVVSALDAACRGGSRRDDGP